jgi:hypothetical protein
LHLPLRSLPGAIDASESPIHAIRNAVRAILRIAIRVSELRSIRNVEYLGTKLGPKALSESDVLEEGYIAFG